MNTTRSRKSVLVNTFGTLGYLSLVVQWAWVIITVIVPRLPNDFYSLLFFTNPSAPRPTPISFAIPEALAWTLAGIVTVIMLIVTIITLIRLPKTVGKQGARATHASAVRALPIITHHKKITPTQRTRLSYRIIWIIKLITTTVAFGLLIFAIPYEQVTKQIIYVIGLACASFTTLYFGIQMLLARLLRIPRNRVW